MRKFNYTVSEQTTIADGVMSRTQTVVISVKRKVAAPWDVRSV